MHIASRWRYAPGMSRARPLLWAVACAVAGAGAGTGCKSDDDPAAAFIARYCDVYKPCCTAAGLPADGQACRALFASSASPRAKYDGTAGEACLAGLQQSAGQPGFCAGDVVPPSACAQAFGGAAAGSACIQDGDCPASAQGDVRCVSGFVGGATVRKCQVQSRGQSGSTPCVGSVRGDVTLYAGSGGGDIPDQGFLCYADDGLRCDGSACVALAAMGAQCELSTDCADAAFCDASTGVCAARKASGASCIGQALECQDGSYCDETALVCAAQMDVGGACTDNVQCLTGNCPDGTCQPTPSVGANVLCGG
jgi:hypothetical protein